MQKLRTLKLTKNPISNIKPLLALHTLEFLKVDATGVQDISLLAPLPKLRVVDVYPSQLRDCSPKDIKELRAGKSCLNTDGTQKSWWQKWWD